MKMLFEKKKNNKKEKRNLRDIIHNVIIRIRPITIAAIIFLIPVIYVLYIFNVNGYILPKLIGNKIIFRLDIFYKYFLIILTVMHFYELFYNRKKPCLSDIFLYLFMIMTIVSTIFAYDVKTALYGFPYRNEGMFTLLFYGILYMNCKEIENKEYIIKISKVIIFYAFFHLYFVILQLTGLFGNVFFKYVIDDAIGLTGNCNYLGSLMCMLSMITSSLFILKAQKNNLYYLIFFIISYVTLLFANSTGPFISFIFTLIVFIVYSFIKKCLNKKNTLIIFLLVIVLYPVILYKRDDITPEIKSHILYFVEKFQDDGDNKKDAGILTTNQLGHGRIEIWKNVWTIIKERPLLGYGPDNLAYPYFETIDQNKILDKAHNIYLHIWSSSGILALIGYLCFVIINIRYGFKTKEPFAICLLFGVIAYSIQATFNINANEVTPYFYIFNGFMIAFIKLNKNKIIEENTKI